MIMYCETMLVPAIPTLIKDFNISYSTSSWILTIYLLTGAVMTPIAGKLSDIYGKKKVLLVIMIIYAAGVPIAGLSTNISTMIIARDFREWPSQLMRGDQEMIPKILYPECHIPFQDLFQCFQSRLVL